MVLQWSVDTVEIGSNFKTISRFDEVETNHDKGRVHDIWYDHGAICSSFGFPFCAWFFHLSSSIAFLRSPLLCSTWSWLSAATVTRCGILLDQTGSHLRPDQWCVGSKRFTDLEELANYTCICCIDVFVWPLFFQNLTKSRRCHMSWDK